jgi:ABC-type multidrug transport system fused ATPase/permease subunit
MSAAKPLLDYVKALKPRKSFAESVSALKRLLTYHKRYGLYIFLTVVLSIARSLLFILEPLYTSFIIDKVIIAGQYDLLLGFLEIIMASGVGVGLCAFAMAYVQGVMSQYIVRDIRSEYYASLQEKSFSFYDSVAVGDLISRATMDLQGVDAFVRMWLGTIFNAVFLVGSIFVILYSVSPTMTLIPLATMPLIFYFTSRLWVYTMPLFRNMQLILGKLSSYIQQNIIGMKTVRIFRREDGLVDGFKQVEQVYVDTAITAGKIQAEYMPVASTILSLAITLVYVYAAYSTNSGGVAVTVGDIILFARYMMRMSFPLRDLSMLLGTWVNASAGLERIFEVTDTQRVVEDLPNAEDIVIGGGKVQFENVTFGYSKKRPVLTDVSFTANPGEKIAVLGATGSGKSSLIYLVPRFYDIDSGRITIDGVNVRKFRLSSLRRQVGVVLQDVFLFSGTLKDNIALGKPDASLEEVIEVAKTARMHDFIDSLPDKYDTLVGERGITLSGGQRQRMTIARALIAKPKILIMDDSLSFVDAKTEQEIQSAVEEATRSRTTFIIAQRLSTIKNADRIVVLDNGRVIEFGTHSELMAANGTYKRIYETQFLGKAPEDNNIGVGSD